MLVKIGDVWIDPMGVESIHSCDFGTEIGMKSGASLNIEVTPDEAAHIINEGIKAVETLSYLDDDDDFDDEDGEEWKRGL
jgi:hypothetical protein